MQTDVTKKHLVLTVRLHFDQGGSDTFGDYLLSVSQPRQKLRLVPGQRVFRPRTPVLNGRAVQRAYLLLVQS
jgi:hypothetical protein